MHGKTGNMFVVVGKPCGEFHMGGQEDSYDNTSALKIQGNMWVSEVPYLPKYKKKFFPLFLHLKNWGNLRFIYYGKYPSRLKLGAHWIESARHSTAWLESGEHPRTASEPIGTRDPVLFHDTVEHDGEFIIYANYNLILTRTLYYCWYFLPSIVFAQNNMIIFVCRIVEIGVMNCLY
jgi:hypothetical protein